MEAQALSEHMYIVKGVRFMHSCEEAVNVMKNGWDTILLNAHSVNNGISGKGFWRDALSGASAD